MLYCFLCFFFLFLLKPEVIPDYASKTHHKKNNLNASWATLHQVGSPSKNNNKNVFGGQPNRYQSSGTISNKLNNFLVPGGGGGGSGGGGGGSYFGSGAGLGGGGGLNMNLNKTWNGVTSTSLHSPSTHITRDA